MITEVPSERLRAASLLMDLIQCKEDRSADSRDSIQVNKAGAVMVVTAQHDPEAVSQPVDPAHQPAGPVV